jgi:hypothetical protein
LNVSKQLAREYICSRFHRRRTFEYPEKSL